MRAITRLLVTATVLLVTALAPGATTAQEADPELREARRAVMEGSADEALTLLDALALARPESSEVALWHGHALRRAGDPGAAAQQYLGALRLDPASAGALIALGDLQAKTGDLRRSHAYYQRAIDAAPDFPLGYRRAAGIEVQLVLHADAIGHLRQYLELRPGDAVAMRVLGLEQYLDEDVDSAVVTLEQALVLEPDNAQAQFGLGMALADRPDDYARAIENLEAAVAGEPDNSGRCVGGAVFPGSNRVMVDFEQSSTVFSDQLDRLAQALEERHLGQERLATGHAKTETLPQLEHVNIALPLDGPQNDDQHRDIGDDDNNYKGNDKFQRHKRVARIRCLQHFQRSVDFRLCIVIVG